MDRKVVIGISSAGRYVAVSERDGLVYFNRDNINAEGIKGILTEDDFVEVEEGCYDKKLLRMLTVFRLPVVSWCYVIERVDVGSVRKFTISKSEYDIPYLEKKVAVVGGKGIDVSKYRVVDRKIRVCFGKYGNVSVSKL